MISHGRPTRFDVAVAVALALVVVVENVLVGEAGVLSIVLSAASALTLVWRRSVPVLTPAAVLVAIGYAARTGDVATFDGLAQVLVWVLGAYSVGAYRQRLWSFLGWMGWVLVALAYLVALGDDLADLAFELILVTAPWIAGVIVRTQRLQARLAHQRAEEEAGRAAVAAADERARIARELHDVVAHAVGIMVVQAGAASELLDRDPVRARQALLAVQDSGRLAMDELARMLGLLRGEHGPGRSPLPSLTRLEDLVSATQGAGTPVSLTVEGDVSSLGSALDATAYRIVQEGLTNVVRHAPGVAAEVRIRREDTALELEVVNTTGSSVLAGPGTGHGLPGMRERVALFGGRIDAAPLSSGGFRLRVWLPVVPTPGVETRA